MIGIDWSYFLWIAPAFILSMWAQARTRSAYTAASQVRARLSGAGAARLLLDSAGLQNVEIEPIRGELTDHYDPRHKVLRLSEGVYGAHTMAAVGIAAHEAGHALQDAKQYAPLVVRNLAVPAAQFGGGFSTLLLIAGLIMSFQPLILLGIAAFSAVVFFQLVNLPVEFDASNRAKAQLVDHQIVPVAEMEHVNAVLNAAAWTYVAGALQAVLTLAYYLMRFGGSND
ncbi:zinc metallopeptidase [Botrimarina sp.]|uniref:zinc metallopeptidase n=1 Tax=Botrimarina sp. TaxID=2795802 RepID=UPI0032EADF86